jgi:hypothetical protein
MARTYAPQTAPFKVDNTDGVCKIIGCGPTQFKSLFTEIGQRAKPNKIYVLKLVEMTASEVQKNYLFLCLSLVAEEAGTSSENLLAVFENQILRRAIEGYDDNCQKEDWVQEIHDIATQEIVGQQIKSLTKWNTSMMNYFLEYFMMAIKDTYPTFVFPNPEDYKSPRVGRKNDVMFPDESYVIKS